MVAKQRCAAPQSPCQRGAQQALQGSPSAHSQLLSHQKLHRCTARDPVSSHLHNKSSFLSREPCSDSSRTRQDVLCQDGAQAVLTFHLVKDRVVRLVYRISPVDIACTGMTPLQETLSVVTTTACPAQQSLVSRRSLQFQLAALFLLAPVTKKARSPFRNVSAWCADVWHRSTVSVSM